ncbi:MAG: formylglycine-generating enzyme family protein [Planctomycetota bacterium]
MDLGGGVNLELLLIPAGEFLMGGDMPAAELLKKAGGGGGWEGREFPQHKVRITRPYYLGKYEVTQEQWEKVMGGNPSSFKDGKRHPVEQVRHDDCQKFVKKLNEMFPHPISSPAGRGAGERAEFRLPTEAEWEHACRAGTATPFWFGEKITTDMANYNGDVWDEQEGVGRGKPVAVGSFKPNPWGLYDVVGNVWECCEDWSGTYGKEDVTDPKGPDKGAAWILRGGSWNFPPAKCRSAFRSAQPLSGRAPDHGLRVLMVVPAPGPKL